MHTYGNFTVEVVTVVRHVSGTNWHICNIDRCVKQRLSAERWLSVGSSYFRNVFGALKNHISTTATKSTMNTGISLPGHIAMLSRHVRRTIANSV